MRIGMSLAGVLVCVTIIGGCTSEQAPKMAARVDVAGDVNLDGKPMNEPDATISFALAGEAPAVIPIKDGKFAGKAPVGESRVEIRAMKQGEPTMMDGKPVEGSGMYNFIDEKFNDQSTLTAKIAAGGTKDLKFDVESKK